MEVLPAAHLFRDPVLRPAELGQNGGRQQTMKIQEPSNRPLETVPDRFR